MLKCAVGLNITPEKQEVFAAQNRAGNFSAKLSRKPLRAKAGLFTPFLPDSGLEIPGTILYPNRICGCDALKLAAHGCEPRVCKLALNRQRNRAQKLPTTR
jgi:hypothetical protein